MIVHSELYDTSIATATLTALAPVEAANTRVKALPNPCLVDFTVFSANCQYGQFHNSESFPGASDPALYMLPYLKTGVNRDRAHPLMTPGPMVPNSINVVRAYQDSGGAENVQAILSIAYGVGQSVNRNECAGAWRGTRFTKGANLTASAWTYINSFAGQRGKQYAIIGALAHSANGVAIRFRHSDFQGCTPMLMANSDVDKGYSLFDLCPVFTGGGEDLLIDGYTTAAEDMTVILLLKEF